MSSKISNWVLVDLNGNPVEAIMTERVDGAFWLIDGKELPAPRHGDWEIRQDIYRQHGYQVKILDSDTPENVAQRQESVQ